MSARAILTVVLVVVGASFVGAAGFTTTATGSATNVTAASVTPSTVSTGETTTLSVSLAITGVNTDDSTTGGSVTVSFPDAVDLSDATATNADVGPNTTAESGVIDADAGTVTVSWDDDTGVASETLSVDVDVANAVITRTGEAELTAAVDSDASGGDELQASLGSVSATAAGSDRSVTETPATLYLGEDDVDITGLSGANGAGNEQRFYGIGGSAEGTIARADETLAVDVTISNGFETGTYGFSPSEGTPQLSVVRPRVTDVTLSPGSESSSVDVTNGSIPESVSQVTLTTERNFADAENATVSVEDADGLDITEQLTDSPTLSGSDQRLTLDVSALDVGTYTLTVEGEDDLDNASRTVSLQIRDAEKVVSLSKTRVVRGESTIASVAGAPGDVRYLQISADSLREDRTLNTPTARKVFVDTEGIQIIGVDSDRSIMYAVISLDDDGFANVRIQTNLLKADSVSVELVTSLGGSGVVEDDATFEVSDRTVTIEETATVTIGEPLTVSGTALESNRVKLYAIVDESYVPLYEDDEDFAEPEVKNNGDWSVEVDTSRVVGISGTYRIVAVADPIDDDDNDYLTTGLRDDELTTETYREFDTKATTTARTIEGNLSAILSSNTIASGASDEVTLSGTAFGQGDAVRVYLVGPRGNFLGAGGTTQVAEELDVDESEFSEEYDAFDNRGTYTFVVVSQGRDGRYASDYGFGGAMLQSDLTPQQAVTIVNDEYTGAGIDDQVVELTLQAETPSLTINDFTTNGQVAQSEVTISGTSNREDDTTVFIEVLGDDENVITSTEAEVNGSTGEWSATVDLSEVGTDTYTLRADDNEATASLGFELVERVRTPMKTTTDGDTGEATAQPSDEPVNESVDDSPAEATKESTMTSTSAPGFGGLIALVALAAVIFAASRRD